MEIKEIKIQRKLPKLKRVAAYARVSVDKDSMLHSLAAQVEYYSKLIGMNPDWINAGVYADQALSGTKANRPEFQRLLENCRDGKIDMIIVKSISRFARNTVDLLGAVRELKALDIDVYFEEQNIHTLSGDGEFMLTILASYAEEESRSVSENCRWRYKKAFQRGEGINYDKLYGYRQNKRDITINEQEAEIVRWIFNSYLGGMSTKAIAKELNARGISPKLGARWYETVIRDMLRNEKYSGNSVLQKTCTPDYLTKKKYRNKGQWTRYYVEDTHPAIISMDVFQAVQTKLDQNREKNGNVPGRTQLPHVFRKMIVCPRCGKYYTQKKSPYEVSWVCSTYLKDGKAACASKKIPEDILMAKVASVLGIEEFDEALMRKRIRSIRPHDNNIIHFEMIDGTKAQRSWRDKSRADSWTDEMRAKAAENARKRRSE